METRQRKRARIASSALTISDLPNEILYEIVVRFYCLHDPSLSHAEKPIPYHHENSTYYGGAHTATIYSHTHMIIAVGVCRRWRHLVIDKLESLNIITVGPTFESRGWSTILAPDPFVLAMEFAFYGYERLLKRFMLVNVLSRSSRLYKELLIYDSFYLNFINGGQQAMFKRIYPLYCLKYGSSPEMLLAIIIAAISTDNVDLLQWLYEYTHESRRGVFTNNTVLHYVLRNSNDVAVLEWYIDTCRSEGTNPRKALVDLEYLIKSGKLEHFWVYVCKIIMHNVYADGSLDSILLAILGSRTLAMNRTFHRNTMLSAAIVSGSTAMLRAICLLMNDSTGICDADFDRVFLWMDSVNDVKSARRWPQSMFHEVLGRVNIPQKLVPFQIVAAVRSGDVGLVRGLIADHTNNGFLRSYVKWPKYLINKTWKYAIRSHSTEMLNAIDRYPWCIRLTKSTLSHILDHRRQWYNPRAVRHPPPLEVFEWMESYTIRHNKLGDYSTYLFPDDHVIAEEEEDEEEIKRMPNTIGREIFKYALHQYAFHRRMDDIRALIRRHEYATIPRSAIIIAIASNNVELLDIAHERNAGKIPRAIKCSNTLHTPPLTLKTLNWLVDHGYDIAHFVPLWEGYHGKPTNPIARKWYCDYTMKGNYLKED